MDSVPKGYDASVVVSDDGATVACNVTTNLPDAWLVDLPSARQ